ncbi:MAG TPA: hypothetical protein VGS13_12275 [Stellaceae bacterium]|nr:hypothetical protein [Stellaceae bacterium]
MRAILAVSLVALLGPAVALAQTTAAPAPASPAPSAPSAAPATSSAKPARGGDITKEQYVEHAVERARRAAEKRFDRMDTDHDGVLTAEERRAAHTTRAERHPAPSQ